MSKHFEDFNKRQKELYISQAVVKFEESLKPLIGQLMQVFAGADFDGRVPVLKALVKRSTNCYHILIDEAGAPEREKIALEEGEKWLKGLSAIAIEGIKASNPELCKVLDKG